MELELKVRLLTDGSVADSNVRKQLATRLAWIAVLKQSSVNLNNYLALLTRSHSALRMELDLARAAIGQGASYSGPP